MGFPPCPVSPPSEPKKPKYEGYPKVDHVYGETYYTYNGLVHTGKDYFKVERHCKDGSVFKELLPILINEYNELLKPYEHPIIDYVDYFGVKVPITSIKEKGYIEASKTSLAWDVKNHPRYKKGESVNSIHDDIRKAKRFEIDWLNKHLIYKIDRNISINIDSVLY